MNTVRVLMLCAAAAVGACHQDSGPSTPSSARPHPSIAVPAKKGPGAEELTAGMVEAASQGKSQVPVEIKFDLQQRPVLGQALAVDVAVMPQIDASAADLEITGGEGLTVDAAAKQINLPALVSGQVYRQKVNVTPTTDGVLLLSLTLSLKHDEITESRAFSVPLIIER